MSYLCLNLKGNKENEYAYDRAIHAQMENPNYRYDYLEK
jgi:hypothetical protein